MYALDAPRSLINYRDLRAKNIHVCTKMQGDEKVIELRQKPKVIATTNAGPDGLYKVVIKPLVSSSTLGEEDVCIVAWGGGGEAPRRSAT